MTHINTSIVIRVRQDEAFSYLTDLRHAQEWSTELVDVTYDGELTDGTIGEDTRRLGRKTVVMPWTVTAYEPPRRIVFEYGPPFPATAEFSFLGTDDGTRVTCHTDLRPRGVWRLLAPLMAAEARKTDRTQFQKVKGILEGRQGGTNPNNEGAHHV